MPPNAFNGQGRRPRSNANRPMIPREVRDLRRRKKAHSHRSKQQPKGACAVLALFAVAIYLSGVASALLVTGGGRA